jgi:hypothetical protein
MPWKPDDAMKHTQAADTPEKRDMWAAVANRLLARHGDEARAIRSANAMIGRLRVPKGK